MPVPPHGSAPFKGTSQRILDLLRRSSLTANEIADKLGLTHNAVRVHLKELRAGGLVRKGELRRRVGRPAVVYELVPRADVVLSRMQIPFIAHLLRVLGERMGSAALDDLMQTVGHRLASEWPRPHGSLEERVRAAAELLDGLGALTDVEPSDGGFVMRGSGCLLAEAVHARPEVCRAMESLVAALVEAPVRECCVRDEHPRCCFEIALSSRESPAGRRAAMR